jgi:hypothetical protein
MEGSGDAELLPKHASALRTLMASGLGVPYHSHSSLVEVKRDPRGVVILEADEGGQILVVARARKVVCDEPTLTRLLRDLDQHSWPGNEPDMSRHVYESVPSGVGIPGGMGGGMATDGIWVHLVEDGLEPAIVDVLQGERERVFEGDS